MSNPIFYHPGGKLENVEGIKETPIGWYFWEETWADFNGPYATEEIANQMCIKYCREYLGSK